MKKILRSSLVLALTLSCVPMNTNQLDALAASDIEVTNSNNIVTLEMSILKENFQR